MDVYLAGPAHNALTGVSLTNQGFPAPWHGGITPAAYGIAFAAAGTFLTVWRDLHDIVAGNGHVRGGSHAAARGRQLLPRASPRAAVSRVG